MVDARVPCGAEPGIRLPDDAEASVAGGETLGDVRGLVRRAVVDDENLQIRERLLRERLEARLEIRGDVVGGDDDADPRGHRSHQRKMRSTTRLEAWPASSAQYDSTKLS